MTSLVRGAFAGFAALAALALLAGPASAVTRQDVTVTSPDGTAITATLLLPSATPPAGGWPAVIFMHGLGGNRNDMLTVAQTMGIAGERYAVLAYDARGHGGSGGLIGIDGPKEVADVRAVFAWLRSRPDVTDARIGGFGISYGGGAAWNSLVADVPWTALEIAESWTDLRQALAPQGLAKTGVMAGFLTGLDPKRVDPEVFALRDAAYSGNLASVGPFAAARSSISKLKGVRTPVFMMQGRRDFAFGLEHARNAFRALGGPKQLWIGLHGHAPSTFPAADSPAMLAAGAQWFDRYLRGNTAQPLPRPVAISPENWRGQPKRFATVPKSVELNCVGSEPKPCNGGAALLLRRPITFTQSGRLRQTFPKLGRSTEVFGSPTIEVVASATSGWLRIVAVLSARTPSGKEIVIAGGGVPSRPGKRIYRIALSDQATFVPKGSRLTLTIGSSSLAQNPGNLLYLDLPFAAGARLTVTSLALEIPVLATPISG